MLRIYARNNQNSAIQFLDYVLEKLPFPVQTIQTDNGAEFQGAFHRHVLDRDIGDVYIKPATPRLNSKVERSHRIDAEELYGMLEGSSSTTRACSTRSSKNGKTPTTSTGPTEGSVDRPPTNA